jgi:hypothetical protein
MSKFLNFLILLIAVAVISTFFAGCVTARQPVPAQTNLYNPGDVVSDKPTEGYGVLILKYDPATEVYIGRAVGWMEDGWVWLNETPIAENRIRVEQINIYKTGYIPDPAVVGQL